MCHEFFFRLSTFSRICCSEFGKELDRTLGEKQKLQMEIEEQKAAMREIEIREAKMKLEAVQRDEDLKVKSIYNNRNVIVRNMY